MFPFRKRSLLFLCNIFPGLTCNKVNNSLLNTSLKKVRRGRLSSTYVETYGRGLGDLLLICQLRKTVC